MQSLIPADQPLLVMAALLAIVLFGCWAERKAWGKTMTGAVWVILASVILSNAGVIPKASPTYGFVFTYLVPALIPLFLIHADVRRILAESGRVGICFILACTGTTLGALLGAHLLDLGTHENKLTGMFTATYTGGSVNYAAVVQATGLDDSNIISAATAVDSLMGVSFLAILVMMPASAWLVRRFAVRQEGTGTATGTESLLGTESGIGSFSIVASLAFALAVVALSDVTVALLNAVFPATGFDFNLLRYVFVTLFAVVPATLFPWHMQQLKGGRSIGFVFAFVFFAAIAAGADVQKMLDTAPILIGFAAILLLVHVVVLFIGGALLCQIGNLVSGKRDNKLAPSLPELIIASNAAVLGATTAPALALARGWTTLVTPGVLVGVAGYIIGTPLGIAIATLLR